MNHYIIQRGPVWYWRRKFGGKVYQKTLETSDRGVAIERAKQHNRALELAAGMNQVKKFDAAFGIKGAGTAATVGEVLSRYLADRLLPVSDKNRRANAGCLRLILRAATGKEDVDGLALSEVNREALRRFQQARMSAAGSDKLARDRAAVTVNSTHSQAASVFSKRAKRMNLYNGLEIPECVREFCDGQRLEVLKRDNYQMPEGEVLAKLFEAADALRQSRPEVWICWWLAVMAGLRAGEIVHARWRWLGEDALRVMFEQDFTPKGKRERLVPVVPDVRAELVALATEHGWSMEPTANILPGSVNARQELFDELSAWMKAHGWTRRQKAHELRKVFASALVSRSDAYSTQLALGHQEMKTTARYAARPAALAVDVRNVVRPTNVVVMKEVI